MTCSHFVHPCGEAQLPSLWSLTTNCHGPPSTRYATFCPREPVSQHRFGVGSAWALTIRLLQVGWRAPTLQPFFCFFLSFTFSFHLASRSHHRALLEVGVRQVLRWSPANVCVGFWTVNTSSRSLVGGCRLTVSWCLLVVWFGCGPLFSRGLRVFCCVKQPCFSYLISCRFIRWGVLEVVLKE